VASFAQSKANSSTGAAATVNQAETRSPAVLQTIQQELNRAMAALAKADPAPYYISYAVDDRQTMVMAAMQGALVTSMPRHARIAEVTVRVSGPQLDNTHGQHRRSAMSTALVPLEDNPSAIARVLWLTTDREYKTAARTFLQVKTETAVQAEEDDKSPDFSREDPQQYVGKTVALSGFDQKNWEDRLRRYSAVLKKYPTVYNSYVTLAIEGGTRYLVSTEGTRIVTSEANAHLLVIGETRADDGMELLRSESLNASSPDRLPSDAEIIAKIDKIGSDLEKLRIAPVVEPYDGPAMLSGRAAAVFFHEVLGHRLEGQRQRGVEEGQTFTKKLNEQVLPPFMNVADDPTMRQLNGTELAGFYEYDDEGVKARRVEVIQQGVLKQFLMSRMPVKNFASSNGHGRAQDGFMAVGRQGNLIVSSTNGVPDLQLRAKFIEEIKKQGKPYGLYFEDIAGGFTLTGRELPQAFQVLPLMVWRVYADGRPDELVRGVDIVGTPLAAMNRIALTSDKLEVFNGICGAESGSIPVSAAAPAMLLTEIEVQKRRQTQDRPPILPPPNAPPASTKSAAVTNGENGNHSGGQK
jgi:TldD protein